MFQDGQTRPPSFLDLRRQLLTQFETSNSPGGILAAQSAVSAAGAGSSICGELTQFVGHQDFSCFLSVSSSLNGAPGSTPRMACIGDAASCNNCSTLPRQRRWKQRL